MRVATFLWVTGLTLTASGVILGFSSGFTNPWPVLVGAILVYIGAVMELTGC